MGIEFPEKMEPFSRPAPYKVAYGGRGGAKSWTIGRLLLALGSNRKLFIVCGREIQRSIKESVHKLLSDQIAQMGLGSFYKILDAEIRGINGTRFVFEGVRNNIAAIKSMEAIDIFWVTEATFVPDSSWEVLLPTVRRDPPFGPFGRGSEVWIDFNPELATDDTYKRWVLNPPPGTVVVEMSWRDNPWFPEILEAQRQHSRKTDQEGYLTVWEGKTRKSLQGAIFAKELFAATEAGRISPTIEPVRNKPVIAVFDLGRADMTSIWFVQQIGMHHCFIDFYENCGFDFSHYLEEIQRRKYIMGGIWLPHDGANETVAAVKSVKRQAIDAYPTPGVVQVVARTGDVTQINAMRSLFPRCYFHEERCSGGLLSLQHYQYGVNPEKKQRTSTPLHNWASHAAKAICYYAVHLKEGAKRAQEELDDDRPRVSRFASGGSAGLSWMGS